MALCHYWRMRAVPSGTHTGPALLEDGNPDAWWKATREASRCLDDDLLLPPAETLEAGKLWWIVGLVLKTVARQSALGIPRVRTRIGYRTSGAEVAPGFVRRRGPFAPSEAPAPGASAWRRAGLARSALPTGRLNFRVNPGVGHPLGFSYQERTAGFWNDPSVGRGR